MKLDRFGMLVLFLFSGCVVREMPHAEPARPVDERAVPHRQYLVGDAREARFELPEDGTVFVVEETTRTVIGRLGMEAGDVFEPEDAAAPEQAIRRELGLEEGEFRPWVYFVPERELERMREIEERPRR